MKTITEFISSINESKITDEQLNKLQTDINNALQSESSTLKNGIDCKFGTIKLSDEVAKQFAGYVCEVVVKSLLKHTLQSNESEFGWEIDYTQQPEEKWYDYSISELDTKIEIKGCLDGKISNIKLTAGQKEHKSEIIFAIVNYSLKSGKMYINNIELIPGSKLGSSGKNNDRLKR